jgi:hypothetical protein
MIYSRLEQQNYPQKITIASENSSVIKLKTCGKGKLNIQNEIQNFSIFHLIEGHNSGTIKGIIPQ